MVNLSSTSTDNHNGLSFSIVKEPWSVIVSHCQLSLSHVKQHHWLCHYSHHGSYGQTRTWTPKPQAALVSQHPGRHVEKLLFWENIQLQATTCVDVFMQIALAISPILSFLSCFLVYLFCYLHKYTCLCLQHCWGSLQARCRWKRASCSYLEAVWS